MPKKLNYESLFTLRSDGRWMGFWRDADGKRHAIYDRDAEALYHKIEAKEAPQPLTFRTIAERWKDAKFEKIREGTQSCYLPAYNRAVERFGDTLASEIEPYQIKSHLLQLREQDFSAKTIKTQRGVYKMIFDYAVADREIGKEVRSNPAALAPLPDGMKKPERREAPEDEVIEKVRKNAATAYFGVFVLFLVATGGRRGEALSVRWQDIDFEKEEIHINYTVSHRGSTAKLAPVKTENAIRTLPLLPDVKAVLKRPKDAKDTDFVFYGEDPSKPMPLATYNRRWRHYCIEMGFIKDEPEQRTSKQGKLYTVHHYKPTLTAHNFRHGYATMLFEADIDEFTAQKLMGHSSIETTRAVYTHLRERKKNQSIEKLKKYVSAAAGIGGEF